MRSFDSPVMINQIHDAELAVKEIQNICGGACKAIDDFFDNFACIIELFKAILMWKSQIAEIPKKVAAALNVEEKENNVGSPVVDGSQCKEKKSGKAKVSSGMKGHPLAQKILLDALNDENESQARDHLMTRNTAKVPPMVKGHIIFTPKIQLNRLSDENAREETNHLESRRSVLSPIMEEPSPREGPSPSNEDRRVPLQGLEINRRAASLSGVTRYRSMIGFRALQNKRSCMRNHYNAISRRLQSLKENNPGRRVQANEEEHRDDDDDQDDDNDEEEEPSGRGISPKNTEQNNERLVEEEDEGAVESGEESGSHNVVREQQQQEDRRSNAGGMGFANHSLLEDDQSRTRAQSVDPLEGPSWLLDRVMMTEVRGDNSCHSEDGVPDESRINFKRPRYTFFNKLLQDEGDEEIDTSNVNDASAMGGSARNCELTEEEEEADDTSESLNQQQECGVTTSETGNEEVSLETPRSSDLPKLSGYGRVEETILSTRNLRSSIISSSDGLTPREEESRSPRLSKTVRKKDSSRRVARKSSSTSPRPSSRLSSRLSVSTPYGIPDCSVQLNRIARSSVEGSLMSQAVATPSRRSSRMCYVSMERLSTQQLEQARSIGGGESSGSSVSVPTVGSIPNVSNVANLNSPSVPNIARRSSHGATFKGMDLTWSNEEKNRSSIIKSGRPKRRVAEACIAKRPWLDVTPKVLKKIRRKKK